jgi:hypothetical protein
MTSETPVLDTLADITAASLEHNSLAPRELMLVRVAALIAVDAPPASYLLNAEAAADSGVTADDIQAVMIGVAPVVGTARVVSAGGKILRAMGSIEGPTRGRHVAGARSQRLPPTRALGGGVSGRADGDLLTAARWGRTSPGACGWPSPTESSGTRPMFRKAGWRSPPRRATSRSWEVHQPRLMASRDSCQLRSVTVTASRIAGIH